MKLAVMQPYFFPYIGYFELINRVDKWVVLDNVQYIRRGWMNRNRIHHPGNEEWLYINAPVQKASFDVAIKDVQVVPGREWKDQILRQLVHYKKVAPHYEATVDMVRTALEPDEPSLSKLNVHGLAVTCDYLGIDFDYCFFSETNLQVGPVEDSGDWPLRIAEAMDAKEYINPPGGVDLYDASKFAASGIQLTIQKLVQFPYDCRPYTFVPGLSIIDVCMWNAPEQIKAFLDSFSYGAQAA